MTIDGAKLLRFHELFGTILKKSFMEGVGLNFCANYNCNKFGISLALH